MRVRSPRIEHLDARMARSAWADAATARDRGVGTDFRSRVNALPAALQGAGLAAALAALVGRDSNPASELLAEDLCRQIRFDLPDLGELPREILVALGTASFAEYAHATAVARHYAGWLHRAVEAGREG